MTLQVSLERPLPRSLPVGRATAVFCTGTCYDDRERIEALEVLRDGVPYPVSASGMVRADVARTRGEGPGGLSSRSGFWATVPVPARTQPGAVQLNLQARSSSGASLNAELGRIEIVEPVSVTTTAARPQASGSGLITVCMATFEPDMNLFRAQVQSLRDQSDDRWICLISDDCSKPERFAEIEVELASDSRFAISRSEQRLGFYRNFERALEMVPPQAELVALCDQDDRWHAEKLRTLRASLGTAVLVYSDLRLVEANGRVLRETLWRGRSNNRSDLVSMLIANTITGAATLFRRELLEVALPFPDTPGFQFHDHWLAVVALAMGEVAYVEQPLYDYVQHRGAVFGHVTHGDPGRDGQPSALGRMLASARAMPLRWRAAYFYGYLSRQAQAQVLLVRCAERMTTPKRSGLERYLRSESSLVGLLWLALRPLRLLAGHTETLGSELELAQGVLWKRLAQLSTRLGLRVPALMDASPPPPDAFSQKRLRRWRANIGKP